MLDTCHNVLALYASCQSCPHFSQMILVFSVALLGTSPSGISRQVDAYTAIIVAAHSPYFRTDHLTDFLFQFPVKSCASCHGYRKAGSGTCNHASGTIHETHIGHTKPLHFHSGIGFDIVVLNHKQIIHQLLFRHLSGHNANLFLHRQLRNQLFHKGPDHLFAAIFRQFRVLYRFSHNRSPFLFSIIFPRLLR